MRLRISKLHQQLRESGRPATMIYVTHDQVEAMTMGERVCILRKGKIMQVDRPMNVYRHPLNKFVAEFVGSPAMNMFSGRIEEYQEQLVIRCGEYRFPLPADKVAKSRSYLGREIDLGSGLRISASVAQT